VNAIDFRRSQEPKAIDGTPPPHDLDAEAAVLSAVLIDGDMVFSLLVDIVRPEDFYSEAHRQIFIAAETLWRANEHIDPVTVASRLKSTDRMGQVGGMGYLTEILPAAPTLAGAESYARTVADKARIRKVIAECQRVAATGYLGVADAQKFCDDAELSIARLARARNAHEIEANKYVLQRIVKESSEAHARGGQITGVPCGLDRVDRLTNGLHKGQLSIIAARPGIGKTAYAAQVGYYVARQKIGVLFFSVEMPRDDIMRRILCAESGVSASRMVRGELHDREWGPLTEVTQEIAKAPLWVDDTPGMSALHVRSVVMRRLAMRKEKEPPLGLVIVDYMQKLAPIDERKERRLQVAQSSELLRRIATDLKLPVIACAQLNRDNEKGGKPRRPALSDLRECGDIENDAFVVQLLHRERNYNASDEYSEDPVPAEIILGKNRNGPESIVNTEWVGAFTKFQNAKEGY
jgi:replicative DNA helicase